MILKKIMHSLFKVCKKKKMMMKLIKIKININDDINREKLQREHINHE